MSVDPSDLSDQARRASRANNDMFDSLGELGDSIDREEGLIDDLESEIEAPRELLYEVLEQMETDYRRVGAFAEDMQSRQERQNGRLEDILENNYEQNNSWGQPAWNTGAWQTQSGWGMYQQQGPTGQQQGFGWGTGWNNSFWNTSYQNQGQNTNNNYGQSQQQDQSQGWQSEFFGTSEDENLLNEDGTEENTDETEEEDYTEPEDSGYDEPDNSGPDGSVDMSDSWNPDASFDYEAEQGTETVTQSFSFSGSGFEPSGSITMEQSAGGETQYFEASF
ncbi:hypothetical protein GKQ38_05115 [Candidatus Nanohaloarchaea archaeon]|nr:hypothetical protein GKQ38_05115 [Candidatus Nanohaloarchaea archaeon]